MKKKKVVCRIILVFLLFVSQIVPIHGASLSVRDFRPLSSSEQLVGHTSIGSWNNGQFFETITMEFVGTDASSGNGKYRFRYYVTHKGSSGSYIYQVVPVGIYLDGVKKSAFVTQKRTSNTTELWGEKTIVASAGNHLFELKDIRNGAITKVNLRTRITLDLPTYIVKFVDWDGSLLKSQVVKQNQNAIPPSNPFYEGHTFVGWNGSYTNVTSSRTIQAQYNMNSYRVNFIDWNDAILKSEQVQHGDSAHPPTNPTRVGHAFLGWDGDYTNVTMNRSIVARYKVNIYTIRFETDGGDQIPSQSIMHGDMVGKPPNPTKPRCKFIRWVDEQGQPYDFQTLVNRSMVLYAQWDEEPILSASDITIFEDMYGQEAWKTKCLEDVVANDKEDGDISKKVQVKEDHVDLKKKGEYALVYEVDDSTGNHVEKKIKVTVLNKHAQEDRIHKYIRSISKDYKDTLHPKSKWQLNSSLKKVMDDVWQSKQASYIWKLTAKDIEKIRKFNAEHGYSKADNDTFMKQFSYLKGRR